MPNYCAHCPSRAILLYDLIFCVLSYFNELLLDSFFLLHSHLPLLVPSLSSVSSAERYFLYIDDAVDGILLTIDHTPNGCSEVYDVVTGEPAKIQSVIDLLSSALDKEATVVIN